MSKQQHFQELPSFSFFWGGSISKLYSIKNVKKKKKAKRKEQ
jgi:hypothetical protein